MSSIIFSFMLHNIFLRFLSSSDKLYTRWVISSLFFQILAQNFSRIENFDGLKLSFMYVDLRFGYVESDTDLLTAF